MAKTVLALRIEDAVKADLEVRAKAAGSTVSRYAAGLLAAPSWSEAFHVVERGAADEEARGDRLALAGHPAAAGITETRLRVVAHALNALAARWPR